MDAAERAAADGEILTEGRHRPSVDVANTGDDAVAGHGLALQPEVVAVMLGVQAPFHERVFLEKDGQTVAGGQEAFPAAFSELFRAARGIGRLAPFLKFVEQ